MMVKNDGEKMQGYIRFANSKAGYMMRNSERINQDLFYADDKLYLVVYLGHSKQI